MAIVTTVHEFRGLKLVDDFTKQLFHYLLQKWQLFLVLLLKKTPLYSLPFSSSYFSSSFHVCAVHF